MSNELERRMIAVLESQTARYAAARRVAEQTAVKLQQRQDIAPEMAQLGRLMKEASTAASAASALQDQWNQQGRPGGRQLRATFRDHTDVLRELIQLVQQAEQSAVAARDALRPRLDAAARDRQAIASYSEAALGGREGRGQ